MKTFLRRTRPAAVVLSAALVLAACGDNGDDGATDDTDIEAPDDDVEADEADADADMDEMDHGDDDGELSAEQIRADLSQILAEHTVFAALAVDAGLTHGLDSTEFGQAATALTEGNSVTLADYVGSVYGDEVRDTFLGLWNSHIDMFVDYTEGAATGNQEQADGAVDDLLGYTEDLAEVLEQVTGLDASASQPGIEEHVLTLKDVVDARIEEDFDATFANLREAAGHMDMLGAALADAIATQNDIPGDANGDLASAQAQLNLLLSEHVWLAGAATGNALAGNDAAFGAAATQLTEGNSADLAELVGVFYGDDVEATFLDLWNSHIGMFVDYTTGVATDDEAAQEQAVNELTAYVATLAEVFDGVTEGELPADASAPLIEEHVLTTKDVVDAQAAGEDWYAAALEAGQHMRMIANPLFEAIGRQQGAL